MLPAYVLGLGLGGLTITMAVHILINNINIKFQRLFADILCT